ncbi:hypothetical protein HMPREF9194_01431 [Treponema maltophilum ATCC 51939]|uniref:OmpR/PhoB-type domain-containing protein n=1 Tax=Treponema maltophilum ATCC 51939 TaxID=1125699 RepID=S3KFU5_TREMA|nr:hypothetical protein [Treponema maltophilum]EPF31097.1 hypothetical protein HMPREF9194_01431 [Treponema maltophilum ATCC 51939]
MHFLILTGNEETQNLLRYALSGENCTYKAVRNLSDLFTEIRLRMPAAIVLDKDFFSFAPGDSQASIETYIRAILFFDKFDFTVFLYDKGNLHNLCRSVFQGIYCNRAVKSAAQRLLYTAAQKLERLKEIPKDFRPAEKKLYSLLKHRAEEDLSLREMSFALWGTHTDAHIKTLYSYIHRINRVLGKNGSRPESLKKTKKGCYKLTLESTEDAD